MTLEILPPTWRGNYPAMDKGDLQLWERWLDAHSSEGWEGFAYNVRLGGQQAPPGTDPEAAKMWEEVTAKRIDAVGLKPDAAWIIEVRRGARASSIGQVLQYEALWRIAPPDPRPTRLMLITDEITADLAAIAFVQGIELVQVEL